MIRPDNAARGMDFLVMVTMERITHSSPGQQHVGRAVAVARANQRRGVAGSAKAPVLLFLSEDRDS